MNSNYSSPVLGVSTYFASAHSIDVCGMNGLPLTPNSIRILGRFQKLKLLRHQHLSAYVDIQRGKHERMMIVCEHYKDNLCTRRASILGNHNVLTNVAFETLDALSYLHMQHIVHHSLSPKTIRFDCNGHVKLSNYGLYHMTECGSTVSYPIGFPAYMAPEVLAHGLSSSFSSKCDIWSFGMILLELVMKITLWEGFSLKDIFKEIVLLLQFDNGHDVLNHLLKRNASLVGLEDIPIQLKIVIEGCLNPLSRNRPEAHQMLSSPLFEKLTRTSKDVATPLIFLSTSLRCTESNGINRSSSMKEDHLSKRPLQELYYLWRLAGGDLEAELRRQELIKAKPSVITVSRIITGEGEEFGQAKDQAFLFDDSVSNLLLEPLKYRLREVDYDVYYPLIEYMFNGISKSNFFNTLKETSQLPLVIKEKDVEYQLHRIVLCKRLLEVYPYKRSQLIQEARLDIPPLYRSLVWSALLEIDGDTEAAYDSIDKETPTPTDRQIEVDIPRCHQYDELLSSPIGHEKFKRILKAWVISHPQYVYWQGLDSLCAPFLSLNVNNEALAYACLSSFIDKYLQNFFLQDNSAVIQEYLVKFSHLIAFHDPELTNHLENIGFIPELYAIPWFLTMYTHVFPLHKIFHLWDTLLLGHSSFPLCIGVAILKQLRNNLLSYGFNECILMFSDMPEINMQRCVQDSIKVFCSTPQSVMYRVHEYASPNKFSAHFERNQSFSKEKKCLGLAMIPVSISELKSETSPRISAEDLLDLLDILPDSRNKTRSQSIKMLTIDVRSIEDYNNGALPRSINMPYSSAFITDGTLSSSILFGSKGKIITIVGSQKDRFASEFATKLVKLGYSYVCILHGGIEVLQKTELLIAKTNEN